MKLMDIVITDAINPTLDQTTRDGVIGALMDMLVAAGTINADDRDDFVKAVVKREQRGSTGFGHGVAVPHMKQASVDSVVVAIGIIPDGINFNALDGQDVHSVFLLLSPEDQPEKHLEAMECVFGSLSQETFRRFLRQSSTVDDVVTLLNDADARQLTS